MERSPAPAPVIAFRSLFRFSLWLLGTEMMTDAELIALVREVFADYPRPDFRPACDCEECQQLASVLARRDNDSLTAADLKGSTALLPPGAFGYFTPALVRLCLSDDEGDYPGDDLYASYVESDLCMPLSRRQMPDAHPKATDFSRNQTAAMLAFLKHLYGTLDVDGVYPGPVDRVLRRGIDNWTHFLSRFGSDTRLPRP